MTDILVPNKDALYQRLAQALEALHSNPREAALVCADLPRAVADAFVESVEPQRGFSFTKKDGSGEEQGDLFLFVDSTNVHDNTAIAVLMEFHKWLLRVESFVTFSASPRCDSPEGFREPDACLFLQLGRTPTMVVEVAYLQSRPSLEAKMAIWRPMAKVILGVQVAYPTLPGVAPRITVLMWLPDEPRTVTIECGAGSACLSEAMPGYSLFVPLGALLHGAPWMTRLLVTLVLALLVPLYGATWGVCCAVWAMLCGRRSVLSVAYGVFLSLKGPWWGVLPVDTYFVRRAVFNALDAHMFLHKPC